MTKESKTVAITPKQFCERFDISPATYYRIVARGELKTLRFGRAVRITEAEVQRYIERNTRGRGRYDS
jgi:excisionase family DNA binding protein